MESYQFVFYGMNNKIEFNNNGSFGELQKAKKLFDDIQTTTEIALKELPNHRELLNKISEYGLAKI